MLGLKPQQVVKHQAASNRTKQSPKCPQSLPDRKTDALFGHYLGAPLCVHILHHRNRSRKPRKKFAKTWWWSNQQRILYAARLARCASIPRRVIIVRIHAHATGPSKLPCLQVIVCTTDMLLSCLADQGGFHRQPHQCHAFPSLCFPGRVRTPLTKHRTFLPRSRDRAGPPRCCFASAAGSSVSAQSVTEAVARATLDKPLWNHALHSVASSLAWFGLAWLITRYVRKLAKENEAPEVGYSPAAPAVGRQNKYAHMSPLYIECCRSQHQHFWMSSHHPQCPESSGLYMFTLYRHCWWQYTCQLLCPSLWLQLCIHCGP